MHTSLNENLLCYISLNILPISAATSSVNSLCKILLLFITVIFFFIFSIDNPFKIQYLLCQNNIFS